MEFTSRLTHFSPRSSTSSGLPRPLLCPGTSKGTTLRFFSFSSADEVLEELKKYDDNEIYVIGGGKVYEELLPYCDVAHVTKIDFAFEADTHFPNLDEDPEWEITAASDEQTYFDLEYTFVKYERK